MSRNDELIIPKPALLDSDSFELFRVWVANNGQHVSLRTGVWDDPAAWGIMLVDLMRHIALAHHQTYGVPLEHMMERIRAGFDAEWEHRTDGLT